MNPKKVGKENKALVLVILAFALASVLVSLFNPVLSKTEIRASFLLSKTSGFGNIEGELFFGAITKETTAARKILIENFHDRDILVNIKSRGKISDNMIVSENNFILSSGQSKEVTFTVFPDKLKRYKEYDGTVIITTKKA